MGRHIYKTIAAKHIRKIPQVDNGLVSRQNEQEHTKGSKGIAQRYLAFFNCEDRFCEAKSMLGSSVLRLV